MPPQESTNRNLLFGILALRMDFINRDALIAGIHAWVLDKARPLSAILVDRKTGVTHRFQASCVLR